MKWREILEKVERGEISAEEGAAMMNEQNAGPIPPTPSQPAVPAEPAIPAQPAEAAAQPEAGARVETPAGDEPDPMPDPELDRRLEYWKRWWMVPLWVGMGIFLVGAALIAWGHTSQHTFWFICGFFPLLLGLLGMFLSWWSQTARWLHVRVRDHKGGRINRVMISMPVPIRLAGWFLRVFGKTIPGLRDQEKVLETLPSMLSALEDDREPISIEVNDKDGSEVQVYFT
jgi:hypothetical protein